MGITMASYRLMFDCKNIVNSLVLSEYNICSDFSLSLVSYLSGVILGKGTTSLSKPIFKDVVKKQQHLHMI